MPHALSVVYTCAVGLALLGASSAVLSAEALQTQRIESPIHGLSLAVHHLSAQSSQDCGGQIVLFIHGATFPSRLAAAYPFGGESWMAHLARRGCDAWALDFLGYGDSDRYPQMARGEQSGAPLGRASDAADQISRAVDFIVKKTHARSVVLIAHSWGTLPAALFTIRAPDRVTRLVLFGPVSQGADSEPIAAPSAYHDVTIEQQQRRFDGYVPAGESLLIDRTELQEWSTAYLASDPTSRRRNPPSVRVPMGPVSDADDASSGHLAYDPRKIHVPTLIVYGEWDEVTRDADAGWLARQIGRPDVRLRKLPRGTHVMHLESSRVSLRAVVDDFLAET